MNKQTNKHIKTDEHIDVITRLSSVCCTAGKWKGAIDVAVKTMKQGAMSPEKFLDEAEVMKTLRHPRLVTLYAVCTQDEPIYIVTELMHGGSLLTLLRNSQKNRQNIATDVLIDMAAQVRPVSVSLCFAFCVPRFPSAISYCYYPRRARSALGVDTVLTLDVCLYVCMYVC